ncbi:MAG: hypothetical protein QXQ53_03875 [Candidatus Methanosuratincola sp.]
MAKYLPPSSVLYWPSAPILWSSPTRQYVDFQREAHTWFTLFPASANTWYGLSGSSPTIMLLAAKIYLPNPGHYKITLSIFNLQNGGKIVLNGNTVATFSSSEYEQKDLTYYLYNVPGGSFLEFYSTPGVVGGIQFGRGFRNFSLISSRPINYIIMYTEGFTFTADTINTTSFESQSFNQDAPLPSPARDISNLPVKRKGSWMIV